MVQPSRSAMMPNGAMCTTPDALTVVTIVSRIIGMASLRRAAQRVAERAQARAVLLGAINCTAPIERLVLHVALAQPPGDLGACELGAEIERMCAVGGDAELGKERERILRDVVSVAIVDVDAILGDLDAEIRVLDLLRELGDLARRIRKRLALVQR